MRNRWSRDPELRLDFMLLNPERIVLGTLAVLGSEALAVVAWALTHVSLTLTIAAAVLLAQTFPGRLGRTARWLGRAWVASVAVVLPRAA